MSTASTPTPPRPPVMRTLRRLGSFLRPYRRRFVFAGIALLVAAGCTWAVGQGLKLVVDRGFTAGIGAELDRALF
jgi:ATP-binding cassette subfamily B protein